MHTCVLQVTVIILASCGVLWIVRLNRALATYEPLFIIPLLQSQYIVCATLAGGIYFQEVCPRVRAWRVG